MYVHRIHSRLSFSHLEDAANAHIRWFPALSVRHLALKFGFDIFIGALSNLVYTDILAKNNWHASHTQKRKLAYSLAQGWGKGGQSGLPKRMDRRAQLHQQAISNGPTGWAERPNMGMARSLLGFICGPLWAFSLLVGPGRFVVCDEVDEHPSNPEYKEYRLSNPFPPSLLNLKNIIGFN